jgi:transcriptional regulator GlxA family with amidase domain
MTTTPTHVRIGVMLEEVQLADIVGIDIFGNLANPYVAGIAGMDPQNYSKWASHAISIEYFFIASTLGPTRTTPLQTIPSSPSDLLNGPGFQFVPNVTYDTCPRDLDILLIGGPFPSHRPPAADRFMKEAWAKTPVFLTTCVGALWLASTGLLEGKTATTNKEFLALAKELYPGTKWLRQRWVEEEKDYEGGDGRKGELWTGGGAGAGECDLIP